jgi:hypothetical protein
VFGLFSITLRHKDDFYRANGDVFVKRIAGMAS